jgi:hypothetical protein
VHCLPEDGNRAGFRNMMLHANKLNNGQSAKKYCVGESYTIVKTL